MERRALYRKPGFIRSTAHGTAHGPLAKATSPPHLHVVLLAPGQQPPPTAQPMAGLFILDEPKGKL